MNITVERQGIATISCDTIIVCASKRNQDFGEGVQILDRALEGALRAHLIEDAFEGKMGERSLFMTTGRLPAKRVCVVGTGSEKVLSPDALRKLGGHIAKALKAIKATTVAVLFPSAVGGASRLCVAAQALGEGLYLGAYEFRSHFGTGSSSKKWHDIETVSILVSSAPVAKSVRAGMERARIVSTGTMLARDLVNTSPRHMRPMDLAEAAMRLATRGSGIRCTIRDREWMERKGMGAALAVAEGSDHPPSFIHLVYTPKKKKTQKIALVGKGITFDSGGLSLKPADSMTNMKIDMGGAASVIGVFRALAELQPSVEVHGICIALENMPSGRSYRPGDVVTAMNGMTIEILNTDAEGRVTLADALAYCVKEIKLDAIVDLATLTGAVITALGSDCTGFMSNNRSLANVLLSTAQETGELFWELPLISHYDEAINSKVADMNNLGGRDGGAIKGALFLQRFVQKTPWAHLDIAGPVFAEKEIRPDLPYGGTGVGVRTLLSFIEKISKAHMPFSRSKA